VTTSPHLTMTIIKEKNQLVVTMRMSGDDEDEEDDDDEDDENEDGNYEGRKMISKEAGARYSACAGAGVASGSEAGADSGAGDDGDVASAGVAST